MCEWVTQVGATFIDFNKMLYTSFWVQFVNGQNYLNIFKMAIILNIERTICHEQSIAFVNQSQPLKADNKLQSILVNL